MHTVELRLRVRSYRRLLCLATRQASRKNTREIGKVVAFHGLG
jgi:hypothetical protein